MSVEVEQVKPVEASGKTRSRGRAKSGLRWWRLGVQLIVAVLVLFISIGQTLAWSWSANLHTVCPLGGVANLYTYFSTGGYVAKLHSAVFIMLLALVVGLVLTGKSFCGWICPLGTVQELLGKVGRRLWPRLYNRVPLRVERVLRYGKYVVLIWILVQTARSAKLFFGSFDPYFTLFNVWSDEIAWFGYAVLGGILAASLFIERPFSRYACPLGAINGFFNSFSFLQIKRDASSCTDCGRCDKACPVNIKVSQASAVRHAECTRCLQCVEACPVNARTKKTLKLRTILPWGRLGRKPIASKVFASVAVLAFALPIAVTVGTGDFVVTTTHVYSSPADIKGSSPLNDIVENFSISKETLYNGMGIPASVSDATQLKDLATAVGLPEGEEALSPETFRTVISYLDAPLSTFVAETGADATAISRAIAAAGLTDSSTVRELMQSGEPGVIVTALSTNEASTVDPTTNEEAATVPQTTAGLPSAATTTPSATTPSATVAPTTTATATAATSATTAAPASTSVSEGGQTVKGSTTLGQIRAMVSDYAAFLAKFGIAASEPDSATLKDLAAKYGFEVDDVRTYLAD